MPDNGEPVTDKDITTTATGVKVPLDLITDTPVQQPGADQEPDFEAG